MYIVEKLDNNTVRENINPKLNTPPHPHAIAKSTNN
jgi:hypothetical protein